MSANVITMRPRPLTHVKDRLRRDGLRPAGLSGRHLARYSSESYEHLLQFSAQAARSLGATQVKVGPPTESFVMALRDMAENGGAAAVMEQVCQPGWLGGKVLDWTQAEAYWQRRNALAAKHERLGLANGDDTPIPASPRPDSLRQLIDIIAGERTSLERLQYDPRATLEDLFKALTYGAAQLKTLGLNLTILRPELSEGRKLEDSPWVEHFRAERWGQGTYSDQEGRFPQDTLLSVLRSAKNVFSVNLEDLGSFRRQELEVDQVKVAADLEESKGSPEALIYKLASRFYGVMAVVYINNRVGLGAGNRPSSQLLPSVDAARIQEQLNGYFDMVVRTYNAICQRTGQVSSLAPKAPTDVDEATLIRTIRENSSVLKFGSEEVRLVEPAAEKLLDVRAGLVRVYKELILSIYRESPEYAGRSDEEISRALSLDDERDLERKTFKARYLAVVIRDNRIRGFVAGTVKDHVPGVGKVFEVPVAMFKNGSMTKGMITHVVSSMLMKEFWNQWRDTGFLRGLAGMFRRGLPIFAWTQSKKVVGAMLELKNLWLPCEDARPADEVGRIVSFFSEEHGRPLDENMIARDVYRGRIALGGREDFHLRRKGPWGWFESFFFPRRHEAKERLLDSLGERDAVPGVGYFSVSVAIKGFIVRSRWYQLLRAWLNGKKAD